MPDANTAIIAALNDRARQRLDYCRWILTQGVLSCDPLTVAELLIAVEDFDGFTPDNDPYAEHDFGAIELSGDTWGRTADDACWGRNARLSGLVLSPRFGRPV